jgi:hypothetical protein
LPGSTPAATSSLPLEDDEDYDGNFPRSSQKQTLAIFKYLKVGIDGRN